MKVLGEIAIMHSEAPVYHASHLRCCDAQITERRAAR